MIYPVILSCLSEKSRILCREKDQIEYTYKPLKKVIKLLDEEKEIYSFSPILVPNRITAIEEAYLQDFTEITTFIGSRISLGAETEVLVDDEWLKVYEMEWHEKIYIYDVLGSAWKDTYITSIKPVKKHFGFRVFSENDTGIIVNNFLIRFLPLVGDEPARPEP